MPDNDIPAPRVSEIFGPAIAAVLIVVVLTWLVYDIATYEYEDPVIPYDAGAQNERIEEDRRVGTPPRR